MENYGHETRVVKLPDDYEGPVTATVVSLYSFSHVAVFRLNMEQVKQMKIPWN